MADGKLGCCCAGMLKMPGGKGRRWAQQLGALQAGEPRGCPQLSAPPQRIACRLSLLLHRKLCWCPTSQISKSKQIGKASGKERVLN